MPVASGFSHPLSHKQSSSRPFDSLSNGDFDSIDNFGSNQTNELDIDEEPSLSKMWNCASPVGYRTPDASEDFNSLFSTPVKSAWTRMTPGTTASTPCVETKEENGDFSRAGRGLKYLTQIVKESIYEQAPTSYQDVA